MPWDGDYDDNGQYPEPHVYSRSDKLKIVFWIVVFLGLLTLVGFYEATFSGQ